MHPPTEVASMALTYAIVRDPQGHLVEAIRRSQFPPGQAMSPPPSAGHGRALPSDDGLGVGVFQQALDTAFNPDA